MMRLSRIAFIFALGVTCAAVVMGGYAVYAWTGPTASAPANNVAAPINTSASGQVKTGDFATLGKIGIGTPSPSASYKLHLEVGGTGWTAYFHNTYGGISFGPGDASFTHIYADNAAMPFKFNTDLYTTTGGISSYGVTPLRLMAGGSNRMSLNASTYQVSIGTDSFPGPMLHVAGTIGATQWIGAGCETACEVSGGYSLLYANGQGVMTARIDTPIFYDLDNSNFFVDPNAGSRMNYIYGDAYYYASDKRLKDNVTHIDNALWKLLQIDGVSFTWNDKADDNKRGRHDIGVIAQDVEKVLPEAVHTDEKGIKNVDYQRLIPLLINAIKEQQTQIDVLSKKVEELEARQ